MLYFPLFAYTAEESAAPVHAPRIWKAHLPLWHQARGSQSVAPMPWVFPAFRDSIWETMFLFVANIKALQLSEYFCNLTLLFFDIISLWVIEQQQQQKSLWCSLFSWPVSSISVTVVSALLNYLMKEKSARHQAARPRAHNSVCIGVYVRAATLYRLIVYQALLLSNRYLYLCIYIMHVYNNIMSNLYKVLSCTFQKLRFI